MAIFETLKKKYTEMLNPVKQSLSNSFNDNEGWVRQGKFTPVQQISGFKVGNNPTLGQATQKVLGQGFNNAFNPYARIAEGRSLAPLQQNTQVNYSQPVRIGADIVNQGLKNYLSGSTFNLIEPKMGEAQTTAGKVTGIGTNLLGAFTSPASKLVFGKTGKLGEDLTRKATMNFAPKLAGSFASKVLPQVGGELAQTLSYAGLSKLGNKLGLNEQQNQFSPGSLTTNMAMGLGFRAAPGLVSKAISSSKGSIHPEDVNWLERANDVLRSKKSSPKAKQDAKNIIYSLAENYMTEPERVALGDNAKSIANRLIKYSKDVVGSGSEPIMGIKDQGVIPEGKGITDNEIFSTRDTTNNSYYQAYSEAKSKLMDKVNTIGGFKSDKDMPKPLLAELNRLKGDMDTKYNIWNQKANEYLKANSSPSIPSVKFGNDVNTNAEYALRVYEKTGSRQEAANALISRLEDQGINADYGKVISRLNGNIDKYFPNLPSVKTSVSPNISTPKLPPQTKTLTPNKTVKTQIDPLVDAITGTKERKFVSTVKESIKTSPEVKQMVSGQYIPKANDTLSRAARAQIKADINVARDKALAGLDDESVAIANELIQHYSAIKDYDTAAYIANTAAENLTAHGRAIQAASLYDKLTPEGIQRYAATQLQKVKMSLKPEDAKRLTEMAKKVQDMPAGADKAMAQQQLMGEIQNLIPTPIVQKLVTIWKAGLLTGLKTTGRNITGNTINNVSEVVKDIPATATDMIASLFTGQRTKTLTLKGIKSGIVEGGQKGFTLIKTGFDERKQMGKLDVNHITWGNNPVEQAAKKYTETVFRFLGAQDQPFYYASLKRSLNDQAGAAAINAGKAGDKAFIQKLLDNPTEQMIKTAVHDAEISVFQNNTTLSGAINSAKRYINGKSKVAGAMTDFVVPFTGVPSSIVGQVVNYTPVGIVKTIVNNIGKGKFSQRDFSEGIGRGIVGTGVLSIGSALMAKGMMTLDYPKDQKERAQWELEGKQPFSINVDGKWRSMGSLGPQASVLFIGGYGQQGGTGQAIIGGLKQQKEQTFLQGIKNISDAIDDPTGKAQAYFKSTAGSLIPTLLGDFAKGTDPLQREINTPLEALKAKIPGKNARQSLLPQRNVFGEAKSNEGGFTGSMLDFTNATTAKNEQPIEELRRLSTENYPATPTKITKDQTIQKMKVSLTPEQLNAFEAKAGPIIKDKINQLMQNPNYAMMSDEKKAKAIQDITTTVRTQVKNTMDLNDLSTGKYEVSDDAPKNALDTVKLYGTSLFKDPSTTISAITSGQPIRKNRGDAVVLERMQGLSAIDKGDTTTQVDHIIPLSLGGTNDSNNRQVISTQENQAKAVVEVYLGDLLAKGKINRKEAQDRVLNWRNEIGSMPTNYRNKANSILNSKPKLTTQTVDTTQLEKIGGSYQLVDTKGNVSDITIAFPDPPKLTGQVELDKALKSSYTGKLTSLKNNIVKLAIDGQLTSEEANAALVKINNSKLKLGGGKKPKKVTFKKPKVIKIKMPRLKKVKQVKLKKPKVTSYKSPTIKKITLKKIA